ncbi:alanine racemase [Halalkalibacter urbisdiaboli]|uniref:alanine racemase n=1 Tax=Halalkalibacter urbisdiaboli TaxID=1960589 RepID=UPI000B44B9BE|nr:alanine racemase [Halalkalibacter urbisdiaboli]
MDSFYRDTWVEVDLNAIEDNVRSIRKFYKERDMNIMAVVKANGYGHGAVEVAKMALQSGATYLGVAVLDEALELREAGIDAPILVLGRVKPQGALLAIKHNISLTVFQLDWLKEVERMIGPSKNLKIHIKFDTGMGRIGLIDKEESRQLLHYAKDSTTFFIEGVFTHFATADDLNLDYFHMQYDRFLQVLDWLKEWDVSVPYIHCGNSAAGLRFPERNFNMFRLGISMYGLTPSPDITTKLPIKLKPAFSLKSKLVQVKKLPKGEHISYGATYQTVGEEWIGTIPIGYGDGWIRAHSSSGGQVLVEQERAPFVGRICMDQCMIRLPREMKVGTVVTLVGTDGEESVSMDEVALRLKTINYEIPCIIGGRVPRVYKYNGEIWR